MIGELFGLDFDNTTTNRNNNNNNNFKSSLVAERRDLVGEETECHSSFHSAVQCRVGALRQSVFAEINI